MIAFGASIGEPEPYRRYAEPGIRRAVEEDSEVLAFAAVGPLARTYNLLLDVAASLPDLEALVLVHAHTEIADPDFCRKLRRAFADPDVAVVGCAGASGVDSIAWWEGDVSCAPMVHRYEEHGGGELPAFAWAHPRPAPREVDAVDGLLLALSPWAVRNVRFDEALRLEFGYDVDFCRRVRLAGRKVATADLRVVRHRALKLAREIDLWVEAHIQLAVRWDDGGADEAGWKRRARRAEAEREAARAIAYSRGLALDARVSELERALEEATATPAWRLTEPLRRLNRLRGNAVRRLARGGAR
jgi:hypothetical protein